MYLTRPKSSKGRSRPAVKGSLCSSDLESIHRPPGSASTSRADIWQTRRSTDEHVFHLLQVAPAVAPHSLNKYNVLPSIVRQPEESSERILNKTMPKLDLSDDLSQTCSAQEDRRVGEHLRAGPEPSDTAPAGTRAAGSRRSLLLAVRAPCGRRFQQHFDPAGPDGQCRGQVWYQVRRCFCRDNGCTTQDLHGPEHDSGTMWHPEQICALHLS